MDEKRTKMLFYASWYDLINQYIEDDSEKYQMINSIIVYGLTGEKLNAKNPALRMFQDQVFAQIDSAWDKYEKCVEAGRKGGKAGKGASKARFGNKNASKTQADTSETQANKNMNINKNILNPSSDFPLKEKSGKENRLTEAETAEVFGLNPTECMKIWREQNENTETDL